MTEEINNLIEEKDYKKLKELIVDMNEMDLAEILQDLSDENQIVKIFRLIPKDVAADVFANFDIDVQQKIIRSLSIKEAGSIVENMYVDDAADLLEEIPASMVTKILANTTPDTRKDINYLLKYPENSAGSLMNIDFLDLKDNLTVEQAIRKIRREGKDKETLDICYVIDSKRTLIGILPLKSLFFNKASKKIIDIMEEEPIFVYTNTDQEEVSLMFSKYDLTVMPVVDMEKRLVGIITIDDIVDIINKETTEDIEKMAAISPTDKPYMRTGVFETFRKRIPWLLILMISATFTGKIIQSYEDALATYVVLTSFIPMLMDTGGNAGGQASVTVIRGLSLNEIEFKDWFKIISKEFLVALLVGLTLAVANFFKLILIDRVSLLIAAVVCISLIVTVTFAKLVGCSLPMLAKKIGFDPAVMASPFITTIVDAISLIAYFNIARLLLGI